MNLKMNKNKGIAVAAVLVLCVLTLYSAISHAGVAGSPHDLAWGGDGSAFAFGTLAQPQICIYCHTPHNANMAVRSTTTFSNATNGLQNGTSGSSLLLWNRTLSNSTAFTPYTSPTVSNTITVIKVQSLLCLSCHDGVGALNVTYSDGTIGGPPTAIDSVFPNALQGWGPNIGQKTQTDSQSVPINLSNQHPISIDLPSPASGGTPLPTPS
jgi:hypothetical protein